MNWTRFLVTERHRPCVVYVSWNYVKTVRLPSQKVLRISDDMCTVLEYGAVGGRRCVCWGSLLSLGPARAGWSPVVAHVKTSEHISADTGTHGHMVMVTGDWVLWLNVKCALWNLLEPKQQTQIPFTTAANFGIFNDFRRNSQKMYAVQRQKCSANDHLNFVIAP